MSETFISDDSYDFFRCRYHLDQPTFFFSSFTLHNCCHYYRRRRCHIDTYIVVTEYGLILQDNIGKISYKKNPLVSYSVVCMNE